MTREDAILEMLANFEASVTHAPSTTELKRMWEAKFYEAMGALGVSREEIFIVESAE